MRFDRGYLLKICSVQSDQGQAILRWFGMPTDYFETMLLIRGNQLLTKSDAFIVVMSQLPYPWKCCRIFKCIPVSIRDWIYDCIARNRYRIFGRFDQETTPRPDHQNRFL